MIGLRNTVLSTIMIVLLPMITEFTDRVLGQEESELNTSTSSASPQDIPTVDKEVATETTTFGTPQSSVSNTLTTDQNVSMAQTTPFTSPSPLDAITTPTTSSQKTEATTLKNVSDKTDKTAGTTPNANGNKNEVTSPKPDASTQGTTKTGNENTSPQNVKASTEDTRTTEVTTTTTEHIVDIVFGGATPNPNVIIQETPSTITSTTITTKRPRKIPVTIFPLIPAFGIPDRINYNPYNFGPLGNYQGFGESIVLNPFIG